MPQTSYSQRQALSFAGHLGESGKGRSIRSFVNAESSANFPFGIGVVKGTLFDDSKLPVAVTDLFVGVTAHSHDLGVDGASAGTTLTTTGGVAPKDRVNVVEWGSLVVLTEQSMVPGDPVYMRVAVNTTEQLGAFRKDNDSGKARLLRAARVLRNVTSTLALVWIDVAEDQQPGDMVEIPFTNASIAATTTTKIWKNRTDRHFLVESVRYDNPTGLAASDTNWFVVNIKNLTKSGTPSPASWSTKLTGGQGAFVADTYVAFVNDATLANRVVNPSDELALNAVLTGTLTLPVGQGVVSGRYI